MWVINISVGGISVILISLGGTPVICRSFKLVNDFLKWLNDNKDIDLLADEYACYIA
jgi:hypothetical protein